jgi:hypothetical protein
MLKIRETEVRYETQHCDDAEYIIISVSVVLPVWQRKPSRWHVNKASR